MAPDGAVAIADEMTAWGWVMKGKGFGKRSVLRGDKATPVALPSTQHGATPGIAIDDAGAHAVVWRGDSDDQPAQELVEIDLRAGTAKATALAVTAAAVGDDGAVVVASPQDEVILRSGGQTRPLGRLAGGVEVLAISHGIIAAGGHDGTIQLWSRDGAALGKLTGHTGPVRALAFAPDGVHLASAADDATLTWDLSP